MFRGYFRLKLPPDKKPVKNLQKFTRFCHNILQKEENNEKNQESKTSSVDPVIAADEKLSNLRKRVRRVSDLHLFDKQVAKKFCSLIVEDLKKENSFVAEINPGCGFLTRELLEAGVSKVHGFHKISEFDKYLQPLMEEFPGRLEIRPLNLLTFGRLEFMSQKTNSASLKNMFEGVERRKFADPPAMALVGAIPVIKFFASLQWSILQHTLKDYGRVVLYAAILPSMSMALTDDPEVKYFHKPMLIFLRTFYEYKQLGTVPRCAFFPWERETTWRVRNKRYYDHDKEYMDIVKLEAKKDFINEDFSRNDAHVFYCFLSIHMNKRNTRIIPTLEKWIPGCGPLLIRENYNIYTVFDELNSQQLFKLFKLFKSWPGYEESPFINFVDTIIHSGMGNA